MDPSGINISHWLSTGRSVQPLYSSFPTCTGILSDSLLSLNQGLLKPSESPAPPGRLQVLKQILHQTPPGHPNVRNRFTPESPDISRIPKRLKTRFTTESCDTFQDIKMSETDSCKESPDISRIPKSH